MKTCAACGLPTDRLRRGLCPRDYMRQWRGGPVLTREERQAKELEALRAENAELRARVGAS